MKHGSDLAIALGALAGLWLIMGNNDSTEDAPGSVPTIYGGPVSLRTQIGLTIPMLVQDRVRRVQLHTSFEDAIAHGAEYSDMIRNGTHGACEPWWACTGDEHAGSSMTALQLARLREQWMRAAANAGIRNAVWNCEVAWKRRAPGFDAAAAREMIQRGRAVAPGVRQWMTSYFPPTWHATFPWAAFKGVDGYLPQIYFETGRSEWAWSVFTDSWGDATRLGWINPNAQLGAYLRTYAQTCEEVTAIANRLAWCAWWWVRGGANAQGKIAVAALAIIESKGFRGVGRVDAFQRRYGLPVTGRVDRTTAAALELAWTE